MSARVCVCTRWWMICSPSLTTGASTLASHFESVWIETWQDVNSRLIQQPTDVSVFPVVFNQMLANTISGKRVIKTYSFRHQSSECWMVKKKIGTNVSCEWVLTSIRWRAISLLTASLPWMFATYLTSGLPFMCWNGEDDTTITHNSRPACHQSTVSNETSRTIYIDVNYWNQFSSFFFKYPTSITHSLALFFSFEASVNWQRVKTLNATVVWS